MGNRNSGRKTTYTEVMARRICEDISTGRTLADVCRMAYAPSRATVHVWSKAFPDFAEAIEAARLDGADAVADEIISIADEPVKDAAQASRQRNRIDARRWVLSKVRPAKYGDQMKIQIDVRADAREAETKADARLLRESMKAGVAVNPMFIEGVALRIREQPEDNIFNDER